MTLALPPDRFTLDDRLPLVLPRPKPLRVRVDAGAQALPLVPRLLATLDSVTSEEPADLAIVAVPAGARPAASGPLVVLRSGTGGRLLAAAASAGAHPLVEELEWSSLLAPDAPAMAPAPGDEVLVWAGARPLVVLARSDRWPVLIADFPVAGSSAQRVPAFPLLVHRFAEQVRAGLVGREQANFETGATLAVALRKGGTAVLEVENAPPLETSLLRAPLSPGFFRVREGATERLVGAAQFADASEADFGRASSLEEDGDADGQVATRNRREHPLVPWATLLVALLMAVDWALLARGA